LLPVAADAGPRPEGDSAVVKHPRELQYDPLRFDLPDPEALRHVLPGGQLAFVVEDHALPLVNIAVSSRVGSFLDPAGQVGLAQLTASMMRRGGAGELSPDEFEKRADFLAAQLSSSATDTTSSASVNCVRTALEGCLDLFFDLLSKPRFDSSQLELEKQNLLERLKQRNDEPADIAQREWDWLLFGQEHVSTRRITDSDLEAIDRAALVEFHRAYWRPERVVLSVSGDVDTRAILTELAERLAEWSPGGEATPVTWPPPPIQYVPKPGVYYVEKEIPQGRVYLGLPTPQRTGWDDPDAFPTLLMNDILGGGGFTSRITKRIRSDEGLAYSAGSRFDLGLYWAGSFYVAYQSKSETVAFAAQIALEEIEALREGLVSEQELATSKASFIDTFPGNFDSPAAVAALYANDALIGRPSSYWSEYRERVGRVTPEDIQRVARKYLDPERMLMLVVGEWSEVEPGDAEGRAKMQQFESVFRGGKAQRLPDRDPVSLEPLSP
jgi:predicted Zn-dependent peptidase